MNINIQSKMYTLTLTLTLFLQLNQVTITYGRRSLFCFFFCFKNVLNHCSIGQPDTQEIDGNYYHSHDLSLLFQSDKYVAWFLDVFRFFFISNSLVFLSVSFLEVCVEEVPLVKPQLPIRSLKHWTFPGWFCSPWTLSTRYAIRLTSLYKLSFKM